MEGGQPCAEVDENRDGQRHVNAGFRRKSVQNWRWKKREGEGEILFDHGSLIPYHLSSGPHQAIMLGSELTATGFTVRVADEIA